MLVRPARVTDEKCKSFGLCSFAMRYINDLWYLPEDGDSIETLSSRVQEANTKFEAAAVKSKLDYRQNHAWQVQRLRLAAISTGAATD